MAWLARLAFAAGCFFWALNGGTAVAQSCTTSANCSSVDTCQAGFLGFRFCGEQRCNADRDCPAGRRVCSNGSCRASCMTDANCGAGFVCLIREGRRGCFLPAPAGGAPSGGGIPQAGVGGRCGPISFGGVIKNVGCQQSLQCTNGRCQRPLR